MTTGLRTLVDRLRGAVAPEGLTAAGDAELLRRFADGRDELAFAELVHRHAPAVYAMCRRHLSDPGALDDAFQAAFVVLANKAGSLKRPERVSAWLCGVADRLARKAKCRAARRNSKERPLHSVSEPYIPADAVETDLRAVLDDELNKLPPDYREAVVLCDVDGVPRREAATRLGIPDGTLSNRLSRARAMLGQRLLRRGVALGAGLSLSGVAVAAVPARLVSLAVSRITAGTVPVEILTLAGSIHMPTIPLRTLTALTISLCAVGVCYLTLPAREPVKPAIRKAAEVEPPDPEPDEVRWSPTGGAYSRDGKLFALTTDNYRPEDKKDETKKVLKVCDTSTWKVIHIPEMPDISHQVVFSADGKTLFAACMDGRIYTWDVKTGKAGAALDAKAGACYGLVLSPDGRWLASGHHVTDETNKTALHLWEAATGKPVRKIAPDVPLLPNSIAFSPDGKTIAGGCHATHKDAKDVGGFHGVIEWDVATGKETTRFPIPRITPGASPVTHTIAYTKNGKQVIVGGGEAVPQGAGCTCVGYLWVFDRKTGDVEKTLVANVRSDYVRLVALSADGGKLFVPTHTPYRRVVRDGQATTMSFSTFQCWDTATWELDWAHESEPGNVTAIAVAPNGKRMIVSDSTGVNLLDAKTGDPKGGLIRVKR